MGERGPVPGINVSTPYLIYYGNWDSTKVAFARTHYRMVILHPTSNVRASDVATIRRGPDNVLGTADDVLVFGYLAVAEDARPTAPVAGDGLGPRVDPRSADSVPLSSITNVLGNPSPGGTGYASYYLDTKSNPDGIPDQNPTFGGCYVNAGAPAWWTALKTMTKAADGLAGMDEILTGTTGNGLNCDGLFLDTLDTAAPNSFGATTYEWTAPGMQALLQRMSTNYPSKLIIGNRGLFFYSPDYKNYAYTLRPYVNLVLFESYFTDSSDANQVSPYFPSNKYYYAPKLNAEASRPDGFNLLALDYNHSTALPADIIAQSYSESQGVQGWPLYRTNPSLDSPLNTDALAWLSTNADTQPPVWESTAAQGGTQAPARVGLQEVVPDEQSAILRWDVARDQTQPVRYNVYYTTQAVLNFATATKLSGVPLSTPANYLTGTGVGRFPFEYKVGGLSNGIPYLFAVRATDSAPVAHEDANNVTIRAVPGPQFSSGAYRHITIDGDFSDWSGVPLAWQGAADGNAVNFARVWLANDESYLYGRFTLFMAAAPFSDYNTHLFVDRDNDMASGFRASSALFGSEMMVEGATAYDQRNGGWNEGTLSATSWQLAPTGTAAEFEFRLSLASAYAGGTLVFGTNQFRLLLQDNRGGEVTGPTGIPYTLASPPPCYRHIRIDGNPSDWTNIALLATAAATASPVSFATLSAANDNNYLYLRFTLHASAAPFSDYNTHLFIDTGSATPGYAAPGITMRSKLMIESGSAYDERNGSFNAGPVSGIDWLLGPSGAATNFEVRISRQARYADNTLVFTNSTIRILLQDNRGSLLIPQGAAYTFADGGPYENWRAQQFTPVELADPAISGDGADPDQDGIQNLVEYAFQSNPRVPALPTLPRAYLTKVNGQSFVDLQYIQRNPPADVQYLLQASTNLFTWETNPAYFLQVASSDNSNGASQVTVRLQPPLANLPRCFLRVAVQR